MDDRPDMDAPGPIEELGDHTVDADPELGGRVRRSINRRLLAADSLDFSLNVLLKTFWEYLKSMMESLPGVKNQDEEDKNG